MTKEVNYIINSLKEYALIQRNIEHLISYVRHKLEALYEYYSHFKTTKNSIGRSKFWKLIADDNSKINFEFIVKAVNYFDEKFYKLAEWFVEFYYKGQMLKEVK